MVHCELGQTSYISKVAFNHNSSLFMDLLIDSLRSIILIVSCFINEKTNTKMFDKNRINYYIILS